MKEVIQGIALGVILIFFIYIILPPTPIEKKSYDYQLEVHNDTLWLYNADGTLVNKCIDTAWNSPLMEIIKNDNK